jgi:hypothetical protein
MARTWNVLALLALLVIVAAVFVDKAQRQNSALIMEASPTCCGCISCGTE